MVVDGGGENCGREKRTVHSLDRGSAGKTHRMPPLMD